jgi:hypothetical protein
MVAVKHNRGSQYVRMEEAICTDQNCWYMLDARAKALRLKEPNQQDQVPIDVPS